MTWLGDRSIHQVVVTAAPGDAITNAVLALRSLLREHGKSEVFAFNIHPDLLDEVLPALDYPSYAPDDDDPLTLVHLSIGDDRMMPFLNRIRGRFILSYHNITPSEYFAPWDPAMARLLETGRRSLELLRDRTVLALADSAFNAEELKSLDFDNVRVGGLILDVERLLTVPSAVLPEVPGPVVLCVGQAYPHKRPDLMVAAFHQLLTLHRPDAHLVLAGSHRLPPFSDALRRYIDRLGLTSLVTVTGHVTDEELVAWYRRADLFSVASEHEGFCVPLLEAMLFEVPIVARANGAIPETLGDAGILLPADAGPSTLAAVWDALLDDRQAQSALVAAGRRRSELFSAPACWKQFRAAIDEPE